MSIGRESSDEWASRNVDALWGYTINQGPKDPCNVAETMRMWYGKLSKLEGFTPENGTAVYTSDQGIPSFSTSKRKIIPSHARESAKRRKVHNTRTAALPSRALGSMTNVPRDNTTQGDTVAPIASATAAAVLFNDPSDFPREKGRKAMKYIIATHHIPISLMSSSEGNNSQREVPNLTSLDMPLGPDASVNDFQGTGTLANSDSNIQSIYLQPSSSPNFQFLATVIAVSIMSFTEVDSLKTNQDNHDTLLNQSSGLSWPRHYANTPVSQFIRDSYIWIHRDANNRRPADRPPASHLLPQHRRIRVIYFLLIICGCRLEVGKTVHCRTSEQFTHINKCVMFIKTGNQPEVQEGVNWLFRALESWRSELNKPGNKELFVFDSQMITYASLSTFHGDVASKALWRSSRLLEN
jgi:DNA ligase 4